jgi:hypothetical protein
MKYVCLIYHDETQLATLPQSEADALRASYIAFTTSIIEGGQHIVGEALQPTRTATTVRVRGGKLTTTDGSFVNMREQVGGFYLIEARDQEEAVQIAARIPGALTGGVEVRPVVNFG